jgi:hypothetical protein
MTIDMDGVLCRPISWFNLVISRDVQRPLDLQERPPGRAIRLSGRLVNTRFGQILRYAWRPPMPRVIEGLTALSEMRNLVLLSGRPEVSRGATERWLERHHLREFFSEVVLNDRGLSNVSFKLVASRELGVREHVDDDGRVAYFLAQDGTRAVYLISWVGNAGLPYPTGVQRVRHLVDAADIIRRDPIQQTT